jgi:hypothetical protein
MIPLIPDQWKNVALNRLVIGTDSKGSRRGSISEQSPVRIDDRRTIRLLGKRVCNRWWNQPGARARARYVLATSSSSSITIQSTWMATRERVRVSRSETVFNGGACLVGGRYNDEIVRQNGEWKFNKMDVTPFFVVPYHESWADEKTRLSPPRRSDS